MSKLLMVLVRDEPLLLLVDDIHWGEPALLELLLSHPARARDAAILLLCLARPELREEHPDWPVAVRLEPLAPAEARELAEKLMAEAKLGDELRERIARAAAGNPLFLEELVAMLVEEGVLARADGSWVASKDLSELAIPASLSALLGARLDRLEEGARATLERGSIEGQVFHRGALAALADERGEELERRLETLEEKELVLPAQASFADEAAFRFRHLLIRDAAYRATPKKLRAELHERFTAWLEGVVGERLGEVEAIVGYHLEQAYRYREELGPVGEEGRELARRAGERLRRAGRRAFDRGDMAAATTLLSRAAALLLEDDRTRVHVLLDLGIAFGFAVELERADATLTTAIEAAAKVGDRALEARAVLERTWNRSLTEGLESVKLEEVAERAIAEFEAVSDDLGLARALCARAMVQIFRGHIGDELKTLEQAAFHARRAGDRAQEVESLAQSIMYGALGPTPASEGIPRYEEVLATAGDQPYLRATASAGIGLLQAMQGNFDDARAHLIRSRRLLEDLGMTHPLANDAVFVSGYVDMLAGDPTSAETRMREAYHALEEAGERAVLPSAAGALAQALYEQGRYDEADEWTVRAEDTADPDDVDAEIRWRCAEQSSSRDAGMSGVQSSSRGRRWLSSK